jgi:hypothetical protein
MTSDARPFDRNIDRSALTTVLQATEGPIGYAVDWQSIIKEEHEKIIKVMIAAKMLKDIEGRSAPFHIPPAVALAIVRALQT